MELNDAPFALSDMVGKAVRDASGRRLGRAYEVRGSWQGGTVVIDAVLIGRGSLLKRLRGPGVAARGIAWENVVEVGEEIVVRV